MPAKSAPKVVLLSGGREVELAVLRDRGDELDEAQMARWVKQAAALPGYLGPRP